MATEKKVHIKRPNNAMVPGWETVVVGTRAYTFHEGKAWYEESIAKILIDAGEAEVVPASPIISVATADSIVLPTPAVDLPDVPSKPKAK